MISFAVRTKEELQTIGKIARRAINKWREAEASDYTLPDYTFQDAEMDITVAHVNGCPLKLDELLAADDANFSHDVFGIRRHLNRKTGQLGDCFMPRYAK